MAPPEAAVRSWKPARLPVQANVTHGTEQSTREAGGSIEPRVERGFASYRRKLCMGKLEVAYS